MTTTRPSSPIKPEDIPDDLYDLALNALPGEPDEVISATTQDEIRHALAAAIPEIQRQERERIAAAIEAELAADGDGSSWDGGMSNAARIARGETW